MYTEQDPGVQNGNSGLVSSTVPGKEVKKPKGCAAAWIAFLLPALLKAGIVYSITDLGALPGGMATSAAGISSNGLATGSGDTAGASSQPFLWSTATGLSAVDASSPLAFGTGVNASGTVVGYAFSADFSNYSAYYITDTDRALIPPLGGAYNAATAINNAGTIVGYSETSAGSPVQAFSYASGVVTPLGTLPGGTTSQANAINSSGVIVGQADTSDGSFHAVTLVGGTWSDLGVPLGYESSVASAISDAGYIAGWLNDGLGNTMAFLWTPSSNSMTLLGTLTTDGNSQARGMNSSGLVVGTSDGIAFLYLDSSMYDLNSLLDPAAPAGWQLTDAAAINDLGQIVGTGDIDGQTHAFLLDPLSNNIPEPATLPLSCGALLLLAVKYRLLSRREIK